MGAPPPPPGFSLDTDPPAPRPSLAADVPSRSIPASDTISRPIDGDTLALTSGRHVRLPIVDAPELKQFGWDRQGRAVPIGRQSLDALAADINGKQAIFSQPISQSYGRFVAPVTVGGQDLGLRMAADGNAVIDLRYLPINDQQRRYDYLQAERLARQNFLGVHGTFHQAPRQFRADPSYQPTREDVAQFWDTPTPNAGLTTDVEQG